MGVPSEFTRWQSLKDALTSRYLLFSLSQHTSENNRLIWGRDGKKISFDLMTRPGHPALYPMRFEGLGSGYGMTSPDLCSTAGLSFSGKHFS